MGKYPDWVERCRRKGTTVQKVGGAYFLYSATSHREPGRKNPVTDRKYIGAITPDGLVVKMDVNLDRSGVRVYEYGFSLSLFSKGKEALSATGMDGAMAESVLKHVILGLSPTSYLLLLEGIAPWDDPDGLHEALYLRKTLARVGVDSLGGLEPLRSVYLLDFGGTRVVSDISEEQESILSGIGVECVWGQGRKEGGKRR